MFRITVTEHREPETLWKRSEFCSFSSSSRQGSCAPVSSGSLVFFLPIITKRNPDKDHINMPDLTVIECHQSAAPLTSLYYEAPAVNCCYTEYADISGVHNIV